MNRMLIAGLAVVLAAVTGCGGSGNTSGGGVLTPGLTASFTASGTGPAGNMVRLTGNPQGDTVTVRLVVGGPTATDDLYAFAFDLVLGDETVAEYVTGSASFGDALTIGSGQASSVLAIQDGDRITVGVTKLGGGPGSGNGIIAGEEIVVELDLRLLEVGTTTLEVDGSPPSDPSAIDSAGLDIGTVVFDSASATLSGS